MSRRRWVACFVWALFAPGVARAHDVTKVFLANDNHTDYGWNATTAQYDAAMVADLDYYLAQIAATAGNPPAEQARYSADCWWYLRLYEQTRSPEAFQQLIEAMRSGHLTVPLNPFVELYGAMPTEAAIRAGYYPGRIERRYGVPFLTAQEMENPTIPWGVSSIWAGSRIKYSWKGICNCTSPQAPFQDRTDEVFRWQGPDGKELLMKWYQLPGDNRSYGGYAEARQNLSDSGIQATIDRFSLLPPNAPVAGLFGYGWDDVSSQTSDFVTVAQAWNAAHPETQAVVSNEVDYFEALEPFASALPTLRGGWGNDWDLWPAALSARTARIRGAVERLRGAEALTAALHLVDPSVWQAHQDGLASGFEDTFKFFEHTWGDGGVGIAYVLGNKLAWSQHLDDEVTSFEADARARFAAAFPTPDEDRFAVFNSLGFARTDVADFPVSGAGPWVVSDVASGTEVPSQVVTLDGETFLRILASDVPSLGYRVYRYAPGVPTALPDAATVVGSIIASDRYQVTLGTRGEITSLTDLAAAGRELASLALDDFGKGTAGTPAIENAGPVSVTLAVDVTGPPARRVRVTLLRDVDRVEIENEVLENDHGPESYRFAVNLVSPAIHFEEVGAIARPGFAAQSGDFLPGTRADYMTLNHFVDLSDGAYGITLSNADAFAMAVGDSDLTTFRPTATISVLAIGNPGGAGITDQAGDTVFRNRFALRGTSGPYSGAASMQMSLAHQNPLVAVALPRNQSGVTAPPESLVSVDASNVVVTAFKPAEEGDRGLILRVWELDGRDTSFTIDATALAPCQAFETSLVETDGVSLPIQGAGTIAASIAANELKTFRLTPDCTLPTTTTTSPSTTVTTTSTSTTTTEAPSTTTTSTTEEPSTTVTTTTATTETSSSTTTSSTTLEPSTTTTTSTTSSTVESTTTTVTTTTEPTTTVTTTVTSTTEVPTTTVTSTTEPTTTSTTVTSDTTTTEPSTTTTTSTTSSTVESTSTTVTTTTEPTTTVTSTVTSTTEATTTTVTSTTEPSTSTTTEPSTTTTTSTTSSTVEPPPTTVTTTTEPTTTVTSTVTSTTEATTTTVTSTTEPTVTTTTETSTSTTTEPATTSTTTSTVVSTTVTTLPPERCDNCVDDDGDGLVDYEDPSCCTTSLPLAVRSALLRPGRAGTSRGRLRVEVVLPPASAPDPLHADTSLQVADRHGELFCATIAAGYWRQHGKRNFVFHDAGGSFTGGLSDGRVRRRKDGAWVFSARGDRLALRVPEGETLAFTVRGGGTCARTSLVLRPVRNGFR